MIRWFDDHRIFVVILVGVSILWTPLIQAAEGGRLYFTTDWLPGSPYRRNFSSCHICTKSQRTSTYLYAVRPITILWLHVFTKFGSWWYNSSWSIFFDVQGAFWGMVIGHSVGISRMVLDFIYPSPKCGEQDTRPGVVANIHFTYFSVLVLGLSWAVCLFVSLFTKAPSKDAVRLGVHDEVHCSIVLWLSFISTY